MKTAIMMIVKWRCSSEDDSSGEEAVEITGWSDDSNGKMKG